MTGHGLVAHPDYPLRDTHQAIKDAGEAGFDGIDLNVRTCRANRLWRINRRRRIVLAHSSDWWKHGFEPVPGTKVPRKPIEQLTLAQVRNLRAVDGHRRIPTLESAIASCRRAKVVPCPEMKPSIWRRVEIEAAMDFAAALSVPLVWMSVKQYGRTFRALDRWEAASKKRLLLVDKAGGWTMLIWRGPIDDWTGWTGLVDAVKSYPARGVRPAGVMTSRALLRAVRKGAGW